MTKPKHSSYSLFMGKSSVGAGRPRDYIVFSPIFRGFRGRPSYDRRALRRYSRPRPQAGGLARRGRRLRLHRGGAPRFGPGGHDLRFLRLLGGLLELAHSRGPHSRRAERRARDSRARRFLDGFARYRRGGLRPGPRHRRGLESLSIARAAGGVCPITVRFVFLGAEKRGGFEAGRVDALGIEDLDRPAGGPIAPRGPLSEHELRTLAGRP